jgi:hypothetical protein
MTIADLIQAHWDDVSKALSLVILVWSIHRLACAWRAFWSVMK